MRVLLIGASGRPPFHHVKEDLRQFVGPVGATAFVSAATIWDEVAYFEAVRDALSTAGIISVLGGFHHLRWDSPDALDILERSDVLFVGGGNTYLLTQRLSKSGLLDRMRNRVRDGAIYVGSSAGANIAGPNILTTNDWNIVGHTSFSSLGLVPFNINPHYAESGSSDAPNSETRDERIREYHAVHSNPVVAIQERAAVAIDNDGGVRVVGDGRVKLFLRNTEPQWFGPGEYLDPTANQDIDEWPSDFAAIPSSG
jgi:dipeptidase E